MRAGERDDEETDDAYAERLRCYPEAYGKLIFGLYQNVIPATEDGGLTPAAFLLEWVLPLFEESEA